MKNFVFVYLMVVGFCANAQQYSWTQVTSLPSMARSAGVSFSIGNKGYFGTGVTFFNSVPTTFNDFWEFEPANGVWTQKANAGSVGRWGAAAFVIGGNGYIGTGWSPSPLNDFLKYDPFTNQWTPVAQLPAQGRYHSFSFSIADTGYIGTGYAANTFSDFWGYNPTTNSWSQKASFGGGGRENAIAFSIGNYGYAGLGWNQTSKNDFWKYDSSTNSWIQLANFPGNAGYSGVGLELNGKGFTGVYYDDINYYNNWWEFDTLSNSWSASINFPGSVRSNASSCTVSGKGYIGFGDAYPPNFTFYNDWWEFSLSTAIKSKEDQLQVKVKTFENEIVFSGIDQSFRGGGLKIFDTQGKLIVSHLIGNSTEAIFSLDLFSKGTYVYQISSNRKAIGGKFFVK